MRASRAFTLVELLVTFGVITILAGLVLSVLGRARASAQAITCRNNLRQWGQATLFFAADNNDFLPPEGNPSPQDYRAGSIRQTRLGIFNFQSK